LGFRAQTKAVIEYRTIDGEVVQTAVLASK
jgi:hypothetical protein